MLKKTASLPVNPHSLKGSLTHGLKPVAERENLIKELVTLV